MGAGYDGGSVLMGRHAASRNSDIALGAQGKEYDIDRRVHYVAMFDNQSNL